MPRSLRTVAAQIVLFGCAGVAFSSMAAFSQLTQTVQTPNPFEEFFNGLAVAHDGGSSTREAAYEKLVESVATMTPAEIAAGIDTIDREIDKTEEHQDKWAKLDAVFLLKFIAGRPDGAALLASQMDRLTSMLNDPSHSLSGQALLVLQMLGYRQPDMVWPVLEAGLKAPDVNNTTGLGPGIAIILLRMGPHGDDVTEHVAQYMRRPDLTEDQLLNTIIGINSSGLIPDILATELVRSLDKSNEHIKIRALVGLSMSTPSAKDAARARIQRMANDPRETAHIRRLAAEALEGRITENPDTDR